MAPTNNPEESPRGSHPGLPDSTVPLLAAGMPEENRQYLATLFTTVHDGILVVDGATHTIIDANPRAIALIGAPTEEIVGTPCHAFLCIGDAASCPTPEKGKDTAPSSRTLLSTVGESIPVTKTVTSVTLEGRHHLVVLFQDISGLERTEESLKESEERYRDLFENANDLIQSVDPEGRFLYVNRSWKETMGYTDEEVGGLRIFDIIAPDCLDHCMTLFQRVMGGESLRRVEVQFVAKDGRLIDLEGSVNCNFVDGRPVATRNIFRDVTERKRIEAELQQSEERYRRLVDYAPEAILVHSEGAYVYANAEALRLFGADRPEQLVGQPVVATLHPNFREIVMGKVPRLEQAEIVTPLREIKMVRFDGAVIDVEAVGTSITYKGKPAVQVIFRDITERKQVEKEREEWNRTLERKVEEKTRHLKEAQAKLVQSEKMAALSEVISGASHELNNPLAGILGAIQLLRRSALAKPIEPALMEEIGVLENIESAATRCQNIVEDLIRFSTQSRCFFAEVDINEVLRDTLDAMAEQLSQAAVTVKWQSEPPPPRIEGDFVKLFEVFANILQNAASAMPDGGEIGIATRLLKTYGNHPQLVITISDTGCGIPAHNLGKIFDPFFTTKPVGKGPGLGLTVSYGIVKKHHGDIEVKSTVGKGTKVTVTLPLRQPQS